MDVAMRPGMLRRAGLEGAVCGIDWSACLALAPDDGDSDLYDRCLAEVERGLLDGLQKED